MNMSVQGSRASHVRRTEPQRLKAAQSMRDLRERLPEQLAAVGLACLVLGAILARVSYRAHAARTF